MTIFMINYYIILLQFILMCRVVIPQVGRPIVYGLAAKGEYGVKRVIKMLQNELELTMALCGCPRIKDISRNHVHTEGDRIKSLM